MFASDIIRMQVLSVVIGRKDIFMSNTIEVLSAVHGIAPRSPELLQLGIDVRKGRASREAFDELVITETEAWLAVQAAAEIDIREDGKLRWLDHLRPIVEATEGFAPDVGDAPVTRWFDDNRFYRKPSIIGSLEFDHVKFFEDVQPKGDHFSVISPVTFMGLCESIWEPNKTLEEVSKIYAQLVLALSQKGITNIFFLHYVPSDTTQDVLNQHQNILQNFANAYSNYGIEATYIIPGRRGLHNLQRTRFVMGEDGQPEALETEARVFNQLVDAQTTQQDNLWSFNPQFRVPTQFIITHNVDLECLPLRYAQDKVKRLGEITHDLRERVEVRS